MTSADTQGRYESIDVCDCGGRCAFCNEYGCATCPEWSAPWFVKLWRQIMGAPHV